MTETLFPPEYLEARARYRAFMDEHVYRTRPRSVVRTTRSALLKDLRARARDAGLWAPRPAGGGRHRPRLPLLRLSQRGDRALDVRAARVRLPGADGNAEILHLFGTDEQKERLRPLVAGEVRSFFSMTEPEVSGSDPTLLRTRGVRDGDEWVIDGHKWFSSGADGAGFMTVFAISTRTPSRIGAGR